MTNKHPEYQYLDLLQNILDNGEWVENRTKDRTKRILGAMMRFDFSHGFPLLTTKKVWYKGVLHELLWMLSGSTNIKYLVDNGVNIWNDDAYRGYLEDNHEFWADSPLPKEEWLEKIKTSEDYAEWAGDLGPVYGKQFRNFGADYLGEDIDQVKNLINSLKNDPASRRHIVSLWNPADLPEQVLPCCHILSQYSVSNGKLWGHLYQRSGDCFLGVPFNIASYSTFIYMLAQVCGLEPGGLIWTGHDVHIYESHMEAVKTQLKRKPLPFPSLRINTPTKNIDEFKYENFQIENYKHHGTIKAPLIT